MTTRETMDSSRPFRVGIGGPVGSGKTALVERLVPLLLARGYALAVVANDGFTTEDATDLRRRLDGMLEPGRIVGVETKTRLHIAVREDPSANLVAIDVLSERYPELDLIFVESGGDDSTLTFSPLLADVSIHVMDAAGGDRTPRKQGPGMIEANLLVINKLDLAAHVGADLQSMERDARAVRRGPIVFTDCRHGTGVGAVANWLITELTRAGHEPGGGRKRAAARD